MHATDKSYMEVKALTLQEDCNSINVHIYIISSKSESSIFRRKGLTGNGPLAVAGFEHRPFSYESVYLLHPPKTQLDLEINS